MQPGPSARRALAISSRSYRSRIRTLLDRGDRAYAHGEAEALAGVARELIAEVPRALQYDLVAVAELALLDLDAALLRWVQVSGRIRPDVAD